MGDIALKGPELKKMMAIAKKRDLNFAYCPGNDPKEDVFAVDRKKKAEVMGRIARAEGTGTKLGMGTLKVKGKIVMLTCERELPQMAKKLKKFLKFEKLPMNVVVMDINGNILEEDIEDLGDDDLLGDVEDDEDDDSDTSDSDVAAEPQQADAKNRGNDADADPSNEADGDDSAILAQLKARAAKVQVAIKDVRTDAQAPLIAGFKSVVGALQGNDHAGADVTLTKLEAAIVRLSVAGNAGATAATGGDDPALARLAEVSGALSKRIDALGDAEGVGRLRAVLEALDGQIARADVQKATATAKALNDAIGRAAEQAAQAAEPEAAADASSADQGAAFRDARADLEPVVLDLLARNLGDVGKMRAVLPYFTEKGEAGDYAGAMKAVPGLNKLILDARTSEQTDAEKDVPAGVVPFVRARLDWIKTRTSLKSEMTKLQDAILATCQGDEFADIASDSKALFGYLDALDARLENALEALVQEPDSAAREQLKSEARAILSTFQSELNTPFFQAVDGKNGFKPVNVRGAAMESLGKVDDALSSAA